MVIITLCTRQDVSYLDCHGDTMGVSVHIYCALFPPNKYFACFTTFHFCGKSFLQSRRARALVTDHWSMARIWCFYHCNPDPVSGWEPKPCSKPLQAETP